jgi:hypothetical protein
VLSVGGSTVLSNPEREVLEEPEPTDVDFVRLMRAQRLPMDLDRTLDLKAKPFTCSQVDDLEQWLACWVEEVYTQP